MAAEPETQTEGEENPFVLEISETDPAKVFIKAFLYTRPGSMYDQIRGLRAGAVPRFKKFPWFFKNEKVFTVDPVRNPKERFAILTRDLTLATRMMLGGYFRHNEEVYWKYMHEVIEKIVKGELPLS